MLYLESGCTPFYLSTLNMYFGSNSLTPQTKITQNISNWNDTKIIPTVCGMEEFSRYVILYLCVHNCIHYFDWNYLTDGSTCIHVK